MENFIETKTNAEAGMVVRFKGIDVDCEEFNCYFNSFNGNLTAEIDLLINADVDIVEEIYSDPFLVITKNKCYVFSGYKLDEYFDEKGLTKVICRK